MRVMTQYYRILSLFCICCVFSGCGLLFIGRDRWIPVTDAAWGDLASGTYLVTDKAQIGSINNEGIYINPFGTAPKEDMGQIEKGQVLQVERLMLYNSETFTSYVLYLRDDKGRKVTLDLPEAGFSKKELRDIGFSVRR